MTEETEGRQRMHKRLWLALAALAVLLVVAIVPPLVSVSRYKSRITQLISASLGRPVRLSSVEVRLLPRPGFLLNDLTVEEDPAYGAEPVLHANTVKASIRLLSLWRGRVELDTISVDEASLNLVRTAPGRWNLDSLLRTATAQAQSAGDSAGLAKPDNLAKPIRLPYLEATNSRINIKNGAEKLPFSLLNAEISLSQRGLGEWRVRLRGQPARTDLSIEEADTGIVRLEANLRQAPQLRQMPIQVDLEWREAQLGQLTRLVFGSDAGWRGDLTGELHIDGTAEAARIKAQLRAIGVHRAEFAPVSPMDFDANCTFLAHFSSRAIDNLVCESPLGSGRIRLTGSLPGSTSGQSNLPRASVEMDRIPVAIALDALRAVRSGIDPRLQVAGSASGRIDYAPTLGQSAPTEEPARAGRSRPAKARPATQGPLAGSLTIEGLELNGSGLSQPLRVPKLLLEPASASANQPPDAPQALVSTVAIAAGGVAPLTVSTRLALSGYEVSVHGQASILRARELAHLAGVPNSALLDTLAGEPVTVDLIAEGPWMVVQSPVPPSVLPTIQTPPSASISPPAPTDTLTGSVTLHNANWRADYLANPVEIPQATLHLAPGEVRWDPVVFSYGPLKGTASLTLPTFCNTIQPCLPRFQVEFGALDAALIQAAFLGAHERGTMLSTLIERLRPTAAPAWPRLQGTIKAESLILGPVTLKEPVATLLTLANGAEIGALDAGLLGGRFHGTGTLHTAATAKDKPSYKLEGEFEKLSPPALGQLLDTRFVDGVFDGSAKIELSGFTAADLAASAKGTLHFEWRHGAIAAPHGSGPMPPALARFDRWTADAEIADGTLTLKENQVKHGAHSLPVQASVTLADPPKVTFPTPKQPPAKR